MASSKEIQNALLQMKKENRDREKEMKKALRRAKYKEENELIKNVGKLIVHLHPEFTTYEDFEKFYLSREKCSSMNESNKIISNELPTETNS